MAGQYLVDILGLGVTLVGIVLWPLVVLILALVLRDPIGRLLAGVGGRVTGFSVASVSITLATPIDPPWTGSHGTDVRGLISANEVTDSFFDSLRQSLWSSPPVADYFVVDLRGAGSHEWLSSRLYMFTWVLSRMKHVRAVVFVATRDGVGRSFVGVADVDRLLLALEDAEPWFRLARREAETTVMIQAEPAELRRLQEPSVAPLNADYLRTTHFDVEGWWRAARATSPNWKAEDPLDVASAFVSSIQWQQTAGVTEPGPGWLEIPARPGEPRVGPAYWEHARWITHSDLIDGSLRDAVEPEMSANDRPSFSTPERAQAVAQVNGAFVALLAPTGRFETLIDRRALLESIGKAVTEQQRTRTH